MNATVTTIYFPDAGELEILQRAAAAEGKPLSSWIRDGARRRATKVLAKVEGKCPTCGVASHANTTSSKRSRKKVAA